MNHHGTPFIAVSSSVASPMSGRSDGAAALKAGAFSATMTSSAGPSSLASSLASMRVVVLAPRDSTTSPRSRSAVNVAPRASAVDAMPRRREPRGEQAADGADSDHGDVHCADRTF